MSAWAALSWISGKADIERRIGLARVVDELDRAVPHRRD